MIVPVILLTLVASAPPTDESPDARPPVIVRTLHMNPEKPREIIGWWVGPEGMIEVSSDGRYRRWPTVDRFAVPQEHGRWHRENHAVFWLEPYTIPKVPRRRAALWLRDDALMTDLSGDDRPFAWRKTPPSIPADDLIGIWEGEGGILEFTPDRRYRWSAPEADLPAMLAGQRGIWSLGPEGRLAITPMLATQEAVITVATRDGKGRIVGLRSPAGILTRRPPPAPAESVDGDATKMNPKRPEKKAEASTSS
jgi:hypothetical protein